VAAARGAHWFLRKRHQVATFGSRHTIRIPFDIFVSHFLIGILETTYIDVLVVGILITVTPTIMILNFMLYIMVPLNLE